MGGRGAGGASNSSLPQLSGSEKQVRWANDIRDEFLTGISNGEMLEKYYWAHIGDDEDRSWLLQIRDTLNQQMESLYGALTGHYFSDNTEIWSESDEARFRKMKFESRKEAPNADRHKERLRFFKEMKEKLRKEKSAKWFIENRKKNYYGDKSTIDRTLHQRELAKKIKAEEGR